MRLACDLAIADEANTLSLKRKIGGFAIIQPLLRAGAKRFMLIDQPRPPASIIANAISATEFLKPGEHAKTSIPRSKQAP